MMNTMFRPLFASILLLFGVTASASDKLTVYAVNYPLAYFAERIGGNLVNVVFPLPSDIDPAFWEPNAKDITGFQQADLILLNGADYAKWLKRASLPRRKLVNTSTAFEEEYIKVKEAATHQHGPGGEHAHTGTAFTTWLDFSQAIEQARVIKQALEKNLPEHAETFGRNFLLLEHDLNSLDQAIMAMTATEPERLFIASHPVYQYLARRYRIRLESVTWEPEVVPDQAQWRSLQQLLDTYKAEWMIWEGRPAEQSVARLQALGLKSLVFEPAANTPDQGDFMVVMKRNIMELQKAFQR